MKFDAGMIFDGNEAAISAAMGTPESATSFRERFIEPALIACSQTGQKEYSPKQDDLQAAFWAAVCDYQRGGFIQGFKAAVQLLTS